MKGPARSLFWIPCLLGWAAAALLYVHRLNTSGDNLDFILLARSIQHGQWLDILGWPRPGGYSTVIAGLLGAFGIRLPADSFYIPPLGCHLIRIFDVVNHGLLAGVLFVLFRRLSGRTGLALAIASLVAVNQNLAGPATFIGAEPFFTLLAFAALLAGERAGGRPGALALFAALVMLATNVKFQGVALVGGYVLWVLFNRRWTKPHVVTLAALALFIAGMAGLQWYGNSFCLQHVVADDPYGFGERVGWLSRAQTFFTTYTHAWCTQLLPKITGDHSLLDLVRLPRLELPLVVAVDLILAWGFVATLRRCGFTLIHAFFVCFHGLLLLWPDFLARYLLPVVPAGTWFLVEGLDDAGQRLGRLRRGGLPAPIPAVSVDGASVPVRAPGAVRVFVGALLAWSMATDVFAGVKNWRNIIALRGTPPWNPARYEISRENDFADYMRAGEWLGAHTPGNAVIFCRKALFLELAARRTCAYYSGFATPDALWEAVEKQAAVRPCFILQDSFSPLSTYGRVRLQLLMPALAAHSNRVEVVHQADDGSVMLRVR